MEKIKISYSQFSLWNQCPYRWKLSYIDKIKEDKPSIHLIFGTAIHETIQSYLMVLYKNGPKYADAIDLKELFKKSLFVNYEKSKKEYGKNNKIILNEQLNNEFEEYVPKSNMIEFYYDGENIIKWFKNHRRELFNSVEEELIAIEFPLNMKLKENLNFIGYIDVLIKNKKTGRIRIIDLKTSTKGWGNYKKSDKNTSYQLILYKMFYSKQFNINLNMIDVEFIILKRKLYEDIPYKQKRIVKYVPASGKPTTNKAMIQFNLFIESSFTDDGQYKKDVVFPKIPTNHNCRFCPFVDRNDLCNKKN